MPARFYAHFHLLHTVGSPGYLHVLKESVQCAFTVENEFVHPRECNSEQRFFLYWSNLTLRFMFLIGNVIALQSISYNAVDAELCR